MQNQSSDPLSNPTEPLDNVAETLERKFGDEAATYAESRSETARLRGAPEDAERWREVRDEIEEKARDDG